MNNNQSKSHPDRFKVLKGKLEAKNDEHEERQKVGRILSTAEKMDIALTTWHDHVVARDEISSFITIIGDKMYPMFPGENQILLPFEEFNGDHAMNWIIIWNFEEKREVYRKNTKNVDLIDWLVKKPAELIVPAEPIKPAE
jgi:hypothetical protein